MRALVNSCFDPSQVPAPVTEALGFHRALAGYTPTPLRQLDSVATELGVAAVQVKDESCRLGLPAFKILGAAWAIERVLRERPAVHTLVAASAGNHGRAVARCAALRGLACRVYLPRHARPARRDAIVSEGAQVMIVDGDYELAVATAADDADAAGVALIADVGEAGPPEWVIDGYTTLFAESSEQAAYGLILVPAGVGSLAAAAARHGARTGTAVLAVEPVTAACLTASLQSGGPTPVITSGTAMAGLDCGEVSPAAWPTLRHGIVGSITVSDNEADAAVAELAAHGLAIGESGAAPLAGLRALVHSPECRPLRERVNLGAGTRVLLVATEGDTGTAI